MAARLFPGPLAGIAGLLILATGCGDDGSPPVPGSDVSDFPNSVGDTWVYARSETAHSHPSSTVRDTLTVRAVGEGVSPGNDPAKLWRISFPDWPETVYVSVPGDTVKVLGLAGFRYPWVYTSYLFPLEVGRWWCGMSGSDTMVVAGREAVSVPAGSFSESYRLEWLLRVRFHRRVLTTWLVPGVGLVKADARWMVLDSWGVSHWELLSYSVAAP